MSMLLCGCVMEKKRTDAVASVRAAQELGADIVELRIEQLEAPEEAAGIIASSPLPVIATCRRDNGIKEKERASLLRDAISAGAAYVDLELEMEEMAFEALAGNAREKGCKVICSFHDSEGTPRDLETLTQKLLARGDIAKLVTTARTAEDCRRVLDLLGENRDLIAFCMGEAGRFTRIVSLLFGSPIGYCRVGKEAAEGQYSIDETKELLRRLGA